MVRCIAMEISFHSRWRNTQSITTTASFAVWLSWTTNGSSTSPGLPFVFQKPTTLSGVTLKLARTIQNRIRYVQFERTLVWMYLQRDSCRPEPRALNSILFKPNHAKPLRLFYSAHTIKRQLTNVYTSIRTVFSAFSMNWNHSITRMTSRPRSCLVPCRSRLHSTSPHLLQTCSLPPQQITGITPQIIRHFHRKSTSTLPVHSTLEPLWTFNFHPAVQFYLFGFCRQFRFDSLHSHHSACFKFVDRKRSGFSKTLHKINDPLTY